MNRAERNQYLLKALQYMTKKQRKKVLLLLNNDQKKFLCELSFNILKNNFLGLNSEKIAQLKKNKKFIKQLRDISCHKISLKKKQKIIQSGGFINVLLTTIGSTLITSLIENYIKNSREEKQEKNDETE